MDTAFRRNVKLILATQRDKAKYDKIKRKWNSCEACELHEGRKHVVFLRRVCPADVFMIGEGPGDSEDDSGIPFVGPAGGLLNSWIDAAVEEVGFEPRICIGNVLGCIPKDSSGVKLLKLPKEAVTECAPRLRALYELVSPRLVVCVGKEAEKHLPHILGGAFSEETTITITHPAAVLRLKQPLKAMASETAAIRLRDGFLQLR